MRSNVISHVHRCFGEVLCLHLQSGREESDSRFLRRVHRYLPTFRTGRSAFISRQHRCKNLKSRLLQITVGFISSAKQFYLSRGLEIYVWLTFASITCASLHSAGGVGKRGTLKRNGQQILDSLGGDTSVWHACQMASRLVCQARFQQQTNQPLVLITLTTPPLHHYILEAAVLTKPEQRYFWPYHIRHHHHHHHHHTPNTFKELFYFTNGCTMYLFSGTLKFTLKYIH